MVVVEGHGHVFRIAVDEEQLDLALLDFLGQLVEVEVGVEEPGGG